MLYDATYSSLDILSLTSYTELILTLPQRHIVLALTAAWLLVFAGVCRSTTWMAWATRITATIPYLLLFILLVRGLSLPGAGVGLSFLFSSAFGSISSLDMWAAAAEQVLFEIGVGTGALLSIAAYSRFRNNVYRDAALLISMNVFTSLLVGMVLFSFLGLLSISSGKDISTLTSHDPFYMVFTVIPSMTKLMRWGPLWMSILFATIVFTGVDAEFIWVEMLASSVMNILDSRNRRLNSRLIAAICCLGFLVEVPICTSGGFFLFHSMDNLIAKLPTLILSFLVLIAICYCTKQINKNFCSFQVLMISHAGKHELPLFFGSHVPKASEYVAWTLVNAPICAVLIGAILATVKIRQSGKTISSLFDGSAWHQEYTTAQFMDSPPPTPSNKPPPRRENTYMVRVTNELKNGIVGSRHLFQYIDPASRGPTVRSNFQPLGDSYGWRSGRLRDWQETISIDQSVSQKSFGASMASQGTLNLFGSPPVSNGFMISDATTVRSSTANRTDEKRDPEISPSPPPPIHEIRLETLPRKFTKSEPPMKITSGSELPVAPSPPAPRVSPSRSEPPGVTTDRPSSSVRSKSESNDELSDSDEDSGVRRQTVIRRFRSEDSVQAFSTESISLTPIDIARQRSLSSVAIFDDKEKVI
ncbi:Sodium:neurotransmitter symporter family protein [Cooperia oncophora]